LQETFFDNNIGAFLASPTIVAKDLSACLEHIKNFVNLHEPPYNIPTKIG
jgi:hypothetical protein